MYISFLLPYNIRHTKAPFLWVFYKQLATLNTSKVYFIGNQDYFKSPNLYQDRWELSKNAQQYSNYTIPTLNELANIPKSIIPDSIFDELQIKYNSYTQVYRYLLTNRFSPLEDLLDEIISSILDKEQVKCILSWCNMPSLQVVANKYGIKVIYNELGPIRKNKIFTMEFSYFDFSGVNGNSEAYMRYLNWNCDEDRLLNNEEILTLIVKKEYLPIVLEEKLPKYEVGIVLQVEDDSNIIAYSNNLNNFDLISLVRNTFEKDQILIRSHPSGYLKYDGLGVIDTSETSIEFIKKCKRVVTINSSVALESILLEKPTYILGESPFSFLAYNKFDISLEQKPIMELKNKINFIIFNYLIPKDFLFTKAYYEFRLENPSEEEIRKYHLSYLEKLIATSIIPTSSIESMIFKKYIQKYSLYIEEKFSMQERLIVEKDKKIKHQYKLLQQKEQQIQEKEQIILEKNRQLQQKEQKIQEKDYQLREKDQQIQYLHDITQSMRIKNRLKKLFTFGVK